MSSVIPRGGMEAWRAEACRAIGLAITPSTRKGYETAILQFEEGSQLSGPLAHPSGPMAPLG